LRTKDAADSPEDAHQRDMLRMMLGKAMDRTRTLRELTDDLQNQKKSVKLPPGVKQLDIAYNGRSPNLNIGTGAAAGEK